MKKKEDRKEKNSREEQHANEAAVSYLRSLARLLFGFKKKKATPKRKVSSSGRKVKRAKKWWHFSREESKAKLEKFEGNPVVQPNSEQAWETKAVFNPAVIGRLTPAA